MLFCGLIHRDPRPALVRSIDGNSSGIRRFDQTFKTGDETIDVHVAVIPDGAYRGQIVDQPNATPSRKHLADFFAENFATVGVNGGYFDASFRPVGLYVLRSGELSPAISTPPLSAIVGFDSRQQLQLRTDEQGSAGLVDAIQAGPFVIDPGGKVGVNCNANQRAKRSLVAKTSTGGVLILNTSDASLFEVAQILKDAPKWWKVAAVDSAVNLDGGPSSAMQVRDSPPAMNRIETGPVRNFLLFFPK